MINKIVPVVLVTVLCSIFIQTSIAQGIGINENGTAPDPSAGLDVDFNNKGLLGPRLTTAQRDNISSPAIGLQIFNLDTDCIEVYFGNGGWKAIECGCTSFPDATFSNPGGAANVPVNLAANTTVASNIYSWSFNSGSPGNSNNTSENVTWTTAGSYPVTLTVTDINNCSASSTETVEIIPCASFPDATFTGNNGSINAPIAFTANGTGPGYTYDWTFPSGTPSSANVQNPTIQWATAGTYTVELTVTDNLGCPSTETASIEILACPSPGQIAYTTPGSYSWTVPPGVTTVSVVCVGAGGGLTAGGSSSFGSVLTADGGAGNSGTAGGNGGGGTPIGGNVGGGNGGAGTNSNGLNAGGGGAGGYGGNGGVGDRTNNCAVAGGGVGILGGTGAGGGGGSNTQGTPASGGTTFTYGGGGGNCDGGSQGSGGGGGLRYITTTTVVPGTNIPITVGAAGTGANSGPGAGAVRIIWGCGRAYPSTNTNNL